MPFVIARRPVAAAPIEAAVYAQDGKVEKIAFVAHYKRTKPEDLADLQDGLTNRMRRAAGQPPIKRDDGTAIPEWPYATDMAFIRDKLMGWLGAQDHAGAAVPFSSEALDAVVGDYPELIVPLFNGFFEAHQGAREKN